MADLPITRQSLLIRLRGQGEDAWAEFLEVYEQSIINYAKRRGLQDADALDVTQEVLAAVGNKVDSWVDDPSKGKFRGWLFRVARNMAVDKVIEQTRRAAASGDTRVAQMLAEHPQDREQESTVFWMDYRRKLMHWAAEQVRPTVKSSSWRAFWLTAIEGKSAEEAGSILSLSAGSVYAAKFRIVARIREIVERFDDSSDLAELPLGELKLD